MNFFSIQLGVFEKQRKLVSGKGRKSIDATEEAHQTREHFYINITSSGEIPGGAPPFLLWYVGNSPGFKFDGFIM